MKTNKVDDTVYLIGRIREKANIFILKELEQIGFKDIAPSHGDILATLFKHGECTMTDIANSIHRDRSTVTALVNKLIKLGYILSKKDVNDSRSTIIFLTDKGKELEPGFKKISQKLYDIEYKGIGEEQKEVFEKILEKIYNNF
ncbi:MarR family transcriptional regulator [Clostridium estertheticum]|uniref:MarR family winged helix-turn-helix transcriptional regulator n=1 Tax=Clostridium estertheticum TaxID=238834 RepID=UPI001C0BF117|nr:MarR family transcriptional regulator [Clostridium estertheticum]MBU3201311.1 MarR family transcriptional regulator [Clostridium estertheticum]WAG66683.1 MarR family transcriptional regulator [Clostridium estertheticum]